MKKILLAFIAVACFAQQLQIATLATLADITGTGATVALTPGVTTYARGIQIVCPSTNTANVRWGDSNTSATRGALIAAGGGQFIPLSLFVPRSNQASPYGAVLDMSKVYVYIVTGDKVTVTYQPY